MERLAAIAAVCGLLLVAQVLAQPTQSIYLPLIAAPPATPTASATTIATATATTTSTTAPAQPTATQTSVPVTPTRNPAQCDPSYSTVCIPPPPPGLNCGDIPYRRFLVVGSDPHNFDTDNDGIGCESG
jgi:hypothetical protein